MSSESALAWHQPVMVAEVIQLLNPQSGQVIVDGTSSSGGHSLAIIPRLLPDGRLVAIDRDIAALDMAKARLVEFSPQITWVHCNFRDFAAHLDALKIDQIDGLLLDLGMSSLQVDDAMRGFSFQREGPLDMRMDTSQSISAQTLVNQLSGSELVDLIGKLGEERFARRIANAIVAHRRKQPIISTKQLAQLIVEAVPAKARHGRLHPATRTFQALRIAVNGELEALEFLLGKLPERLASGARVVVLTFHSLEDRLVKRAFAQGAREGFWSVLTKKPLQPTEEEKARNPRSRSAKLRAIKIAEKG